VARESGRAETGRDFVDVVVGNDKQMSSFFDRLETGRNLWKRAENKASTLFIGSQQNQTESNQTEGD
jgi:hypothetical protein